MTSPLPTLDGSPGCGPVPADPAALERGCEFPACDGHLGLLLSLPDDPVGYRQGVRDVLAPVVLARKSRSLARDDPSEVRRWAKSKADPRGAHRSLPRQWLTYERGARSPRTAAVGGPTTPHHGLVIVAGDSLLGSRHLGPHGPTVAPDQGVLWMSPTR